MNPVKFLQAIDYIIYIPSFYLYRVLNHMYDSYIEIFKLN